MSFLTRFISCGLAVILLTSDLSACLWVPGTSQDGTFHIVEGGPADRELKRSLEKDPEYEGSYLLTKHSNDTNFEGRVSYAAGLIYSGKQAEAIDLLNTLEKEKPGAYHVAANLGTAYELAGKNTEALHWISEGVNRNPESHNGSEWVHIRILETKLAAEKDPKYFEQHTVLDLQPPLKATKQANIQLFSKQFTAEKIRKDLEYQLRERLHFVKTADPVVASLLFDLATVEAAIGTLENASSFLKLAKQFGIPSARIDPLLDSYSAIIKKAKFNHNAQKYGWIPVLIALIAAYIITRRRSLRKAM